MESTFASLDWSVHATREHWPRSSEGAFIAAAIQRLGHLELCDWMEDEPRWANQQRLPYLPPPEIAFNDDQPVEKVHHDFASIVRAYLSPAEFEARHLARRIEAQLAAGDGLDVDLVGQIHAADLRAYCNEDQDDPITLAHWAGVWREWLEINSQIDGAESRLPLVADQVINLAQSGRLKAFARAHGGGVLTSIDRVLWEIDNDVCLRRLASCSINLEIPLALDAPPTHWIFIDKSDLDREMLEYEKAQALQAAQPGKPLEMLAEGTHNDCATWLMIQFEDPNCPFATKEQFFEGAATKFGRSLSERGFLKAWGAATLDYPDRRRSGPRLKGRNSAR